MSPAGPVLHVLGARPNFVKAAPVLAALRERGLRQQVVHTGQHYDPALSEVFFRDLELPEPDRALGVGSGSHAVQTAALLTGLEAAFDQLRPALVIGYGDVNSTLAAALVAAKSGVPLAHVEAGLRSFDTSMPEEVNRRVVDTLSDVLLVTSPEAMANLGREGVEVTRLHLVGNPMIDSLLRALPRLDPDRALTGLGLAHLRGGYCVATVHRPANVDTPTAADALVGALRGLAGLLPVVLPLHPRGRAALTRAGLADVPGIHLTEPLGYPEFLSLVRGARLVVTDSGGVQEETTVLAVPCLTMRPNTERPVTITHGTNRLVELADLERAAAAALLSPPHPLELPPLWDGRAGQRIAGVLSNWLDAHAGHR